MIEVCSSARLHLGFYTLAMDNVAYGSIGVAVDKPTVMIRVRKSDNIVVKNNTGIPVEKEIREAIESLNVPGAEVEVVKAIPRHVGLGSTTQLMLSTAYAVSRLYGLKYSIRQLAFKLKRGWVSGVGIAAFERGGFIIDSGRRLEGKKVGVPKDPSDLPRVIYRSPLPKSWYFIVVLPKGIRGLDEREEKPLLEAPETDEELEYELHRAVLLGMLHALARRDIKGFGEALTNIQFLVGQYFSRYQGGVFCCRETETIVNALLEGGAYGVGQSSWGPTAYGLVRGRKEAREILDYLTKILEENNIDAEIFVTNVRNNRASLRFIKYYSM